MRIPFFGKRIRYTGVTPPLRLWRKYPIWEYCLGEEGYPDQDETTIRPSSAKFWLPRPEVDLAAAMGEARLASDRVVPAKLGICGDRARYLSIFFRTHPLDATSLWRLRFDDDRSVWDDDVDPGGDRMFEADHPGQKCPHVSLSDPTVFPLVVTTFAPKYPHTTSYSLSIDSDGVEREGS